MITNLKSKLRNTTTQTCVSKHQHESKMQHRNKSLGILEPTNIKLNKGLLFACIIRSRCVGRCIDKAEEQL